MTKTLPPPSLAPDSCPTPRETPAAIRAVSAREELAAFVQWLPDEVVAELLEIARARSGH